MPVMCTWSARGLWHVEDVVRLTGSDSISTHAFQSSWLLLMLVVRASLSRSAAGSPAPSGLASLAATADILAEALFAAFRAGRVLRAGGEVILISSGCWSRDSVSGAAAASGWMLSWDGDIFGGRGDGGFKEGKEKEL